MVISRLARAVALMPTDAGFKSQRIFFNPKMMQREIELQRVVVKLNGRILFRSGAAFTPFGLFGMAKKPVSQVCAWTGTADFDTDHASPSIRIGE